jgi:XFP N-terminal domain/Histidine phosphatase superfamily (branch 1)
MASATTAVKRTTPKPIPNLIAETGAVSISAYGSTRSTVSGAPLSAEELEQVDAYWRASLYLCLGMLYLQENPLLREPLKIEHVKPRLLGHWGSDAGQAFTYIHFNRLINKYDLDAIYVSGPGHGAPGVLSQAYLEGTYSEVYPDKSEDLAGMRRFFKQFSFPGGIGSHCTPETPGSIHEGGELGYSISHAYGTVLDHPNLIALTMVGDGEAETGPLATSWHSNKDILKERPGWELYRDGCPDGETPGDVAARADRFIARVHGITGDVLAFSSGHIIRMIAARWLRLSPAAGRVFFCDPASVGVLGFEHNDRAQPVIRRWNFVSQLFE